jgi:hypothetical protein
MTRALIGRPFGEQIGGADHLSREALCALPDIRLQTGVEAREMPRGPKTREQIGGECGVASLRSDPRHVNAIGTLHGGVLCVLLALPRAESRVIDRGRNVGFLRTPRNDVPRRQRILCAVGGVDKNGSVERPRRADLYQSIDDTIVQ